LSFLILIVILKRQKINKKDLKLSKWNLEEKKQIKTILNRYINNIGYRLNYYLLVVLIFVNYKYMNDLSNLDNKDE
jgi:hypothetical protein